MSQENLTVGDLHPSNDKGRGPDAQVLSPPPKIEQQSLDDEDVRQDNPKTPKLVVELFDLLKNTPDDTTGSKDLDMKLEKYESPTDTRFLADLVNTAEECSRTILLHVAAERGFVEMASRLIKAGADVNAGDNDEAQPLHLACYSKQKGIVKLLLKNKAYAPLARFLERHLEYTGYL